ncbi:hypothetical protein ILYODFUR_030306, partial [Ilyodon furcidens]
QKLDPQYYKLVSDDTQTEVCLATGFTRHDATKGNMPNGTASQITKDGKPTGVYNQVAFLESDEKCGDNSTSKLLEPCISTLEPGTCGTRLNLPLCVLKCFHLGLIILLLLFADEMVNLASLTIFGLRVIFMKTVVFNVLMTLRLWISQ